MAIRIKYTYKEYEGFPETTELSQRRAYNQTVLGVVDILTFLSILFIAISDFLVMWPILFFEILPILFLFYLIIIYPIITEKKYKDLWKKKP